MATENGIFSYQPTTSGIYTWNFRMKNSGMVAQPASVYYLDNLVASYPIPYTRIDCDKGQNASYRFGFNTQEKDNEVYGEGNLNTALFWEYDTRLGRRWNTDPKPFIGISDYATFTNNPILHNDILGDRIVDEKGRTAAIIDKKGNVHFTKYATQDIKDVVGPMLETKTGRQVAKDMVKAKHNIQIEVDRSPQSTYENSTTKEKYKADKPINDNDNIVFGDTKNKLGIGAKSGKVKEIQSSKIIIYEGSINNSKESKFKESVTNDFNLDYKNTDKNTIMGGKGVHEGTHATDIESSKGKTYEEKEAIPRNNEVKHYNESKK